MSNKANLYSEHAVDISTFSDHGSVKSHPTFKIWYSLMSHRCHMTLFFLMLNVNSSSLKANLNVKVSNHLIAVQKGRRRSALQSERRQLLFIETDRVYYMQNVLKRKRVRPQFVLIRKWCRLMRWCLTYYEMMHHYCATLQNMAHIISSVMMPWVRNFSNYIWKEF